MNSNEEWEKTFDAINDIVTIQDKDMRIIRANKAAHDTFGINNDSIIGKFCYEVFSGSPSPCTGCPEPSSLQDKGRHSGIITHVTLDKTFLVTSTPIFNEANEVDHIIHVAKDITKEQKTEEERALFSTLVNETSDAIYIIDPQTGAFLFANQKGCDNLGYTQEEMYQLSVFDVDLSLGTEERWQERVSSIKQHGFKIFEINQKKKDNTYLPVEVNVKVITYKGKEYLIAVVRDITERKIAEEKLIQESNKLEAVVSALGDGVTYQDKNFKILYQNETHKQKQGDHQGEYCYSAYQGRDCICEGCLLEKCFEDGQIHRRETMAETDKGTIHLEVSASPIKDGSGQIIGGIETVRDITTRKTLEAQVLQDQKMESLGTLAGGIAHDFNNILAGIIGYADLLKDDLPVSSLSRNHLDQIFKAGNRAKELVKQILTFSRKDIAREGPIELTPIIKEVLKLMRASLPSSIEIKEEINTPPYSCIIANPINIHQVLVNLCTNALHAMQDEKGILTIKLNKVNLTEADVAFEPDVSAGSFIELIVSDTGCGMDGRTIERVFEPYYTTKKAGKGTGLGLALVHGVVKRSGGFIRVESELNKGTTFHVYFRSVGEQTDITEQKPNKGLPHGNERILAVDDEAIIADMYKATLEHLGYTVTTVNQSEKALEIFQSSPESFDLVISDQTMPHLTGAELAEQILQIRSDIPVILCTGYSSLMSESKAKEIGIEKFVMKPVSGRDLAAIVREALDNRES